MTSGRRRFWRAVLVMLDCGHTEKLNTGRWRVTKDVEAIYLGAAIRKDVWCGVCGWRAQPTMSLGVVRDGEATHAATDDDGSTSNP